VAEPVQPEGPAEVRALFWLTVKVNPPTPWVALPVAVMV
jgi:hypothetical protein